MALHSLEESLDQAERAVDEDGVDLDLALAAMLRAHQTLIESEQRYHLFIEQSSDGVFRCDMRGPVDVHASTDEQVEAMYRYSHFAWCNLAMAKLLHFARVEDIVGKPLREMMPPSDAARSYLRRFVENSYRTVEEVTEDSDVTGKPVKTLHSSIGRVENGNLVSVWGKVRRAKVEETDDPESNDPTAIAEQLTQLAIVAQDARVPPDLKLELQRLSRTLDRLAGRTD
ncbi:MAG: PAS domain-containing protein [Tepidisphaeraceae bacterium]